MEIRAATVDDADALARVHIESWRSAYRGLVPDSYLERLDYRKGAQRWREHLADRGGDIFLVEDAGTVVGLLTIGRCRNADLDPATTGEICAIYILPERWRLGMGRALCQYAERLLESRGCELVTLWVFRANEQARRFYEAMGFAPDGASKTLERDAPLEVIRYRKSIRHAEIRAAPDGPR